MTDVQQPTLPEAFAAKLDTQVKESIQYWYQTATEAEKKIDQDFMASMQESPEAMNKIMAEASADFNAADANGDGVLDLAEYTTFHNK